LGVAAVTAFPPLDLRCAPERSNDDYSDAYLSDPALRSTTGGNASMSSALIGS
jgi:hypothetical protein